MRKWIAALLGGCIFLTLAGCAKQPAKRTDTGKTTVSSTVTSTTSVAETSATQPSQTQMQTNQTTKKAATTKKQVATTTAGMKNKPRYIGYKYAPTGAKATGACYAGNVRQGGKSFGAMGNVCAVAGGTSAARFSNGTAMNSVLQLSGTNLTIGYLVPFEIVLQYENPQRDIIFDVLISDTQGSSKCVYSSTSSKYKIKNIDTDWDDAKNTYITSVTLSIPASSQLKSRRVEILETTFLRDKVSGKADFLKSANRVMNFTVEDQSVQYVLEGDSYTVSKYVGPNPVVIIPETYNGKPVTKIGAGAFGGNYGLKKVVIPATIVFIGSGAFMDIPYADIYVYAMSPVIADTSAFEMSKKVHCLKGSTVEECGKYFGLSYAIIAQ